MNFKIIPEIKLLIRTLENKIEADRGYKSRKKERELIYKNTKYAENKICPKCGQNLVDKINVYYIRRLWQIDLCAIKCNCGYFWSTESKNDSDKIFEDLRNGEIKVIHGVSKYNKIHEFIWSCDEKKIY